jgi:cobalt/nickel transport system permease protein
LSGLPRSLRDVFSSLEGLTQSGSYARVGGFLQSLHPVARLLAVACLITASLFANRPESLLLMALVPALLSLASRIPSVRYFLSTALVPLPASLTMILVVFMTPGTPLAAWDFGWVTIHVTGEGVAKFAVFALRVWLCFASLSLLTLTMGIDGIIGVLATLRVPVFLLQLISLTYSFIRLSLGEAAQMLFAREARLHRQRRVINLTDLRGLASILAVLVLRTLERGERVYMAMKARGYEQGVYHPPKAAPIRARDLLFIACIAAFSLIALGAPQWL